MEAFNTRDKWGERAFVLSFLKAMRDEDLESCLFYPPDLYSLCKESKSDKTDADSVKNSTSITILLLLKQLANCPPHMLPLDVKVFVDLSGQVIVERLFHMAYVS